MNAYFAGEKLGGLAFGLSGLFAVIVGILVFRYAASYRAMLWPLFLIALPEIGVCIGLLLRTDGQLAHLTAQLGADPSAFYSAEGARMAVVMRNFKIIELVEVLALCAGIGLALAARRDATFAVGVGMILQASAMLVGDLAAERRGAPYVAALRAGAQGAAASDQPRAAARP